jgi:hypothetical protein
VFSDVESGWLVHGGPDVLVEPQTLAFIEDGSGSRSER